MGLITNECIECIKIKFKFKLALYYSVLLIKLFTMAESYFKNKLYTALVNVQCSTYGIASQAQHCSDLIRLKFRICNFNSFPFKQSVLFNIIRVLVIKKMQSVTSIGALHLL